MKQLKDKMNLNTIEALGTKWCIELFETDVDVSDIQAATETFLGEFEARYSRFRADSWLSQLNVKRVFKNPDPEFLILLTQAVAFYKQTEGIFNIAIGEKMVDSGYDSSYSLEVKKTSTVVPSLTDVLSISGSTITLTSGSLDLGGIGKGFVIDALAQLYKKKFNLQYFLINGGGDMYATSDHGQPISITLAHPTDRALGIGTVDLLHQGFAASSPHVRAWPDRVTGKVHNHLHTNTKISSYVVAQNACTADVWATTCAICPESDIPSDLSVLLLEDTKVVRSAELFMLQTASQ